VCLLGINRRFCFLDSCFPYCSIMEMGSMSSSEASTEFKRSTADRTLRNYSCEYFKSYFILAVSKLKYRGLAKWCILFCIIFYPLSKRRLKASILYIFRGIYTRHFVYRRCMQSPVCARFQTFRARNLVWHRAHKRPFCKKIFYLFLLCDLVILRKMSVLKTNTHTHKHVKIQVYIK
jgi:hypothetical protein